jgi:hypothetical protein
VIFLSGYEKIIVAGGFARNLWHFWIEFVQYFLGLTGNIWDIDIQIVGEGAM